MHANQLHPIDPLDMALWLSVAGVALYTAVELRRRGAEWIERKRRERYLSDQHRLRKVAMIRARLNEADDMGRYLNTVLGSIAMSIPPPVSPPPAADQHQQEIEARYSYSRAVGIAALTGKQPYYTGKGWAIK